MLIGQITDIHIGFEPGNPDEPNMHRLRAVLERLFDGPNRPDLLLLTGDLTEKVQFSRTGGRVGDVAVPLPANRLPPRVVDHAELLRSGGDDALGLESHMSVCEGLEVYRPQASAGKADELAKALFIGRTALNWLMAEYPGVPLRADIGV